MHINSHSSLKISLNKIISKAAIAFLMVILILNNGYPSSYHLVNAEGPCGDTYIVISGDTIESIADLCSTDVESILEINPEISDPNDLYAGQIIRIPDVDSELTTTIAISPTCGLPGQTLLIVGSGFPVNTNVGLKLIQQGTNSYIVGNTTSDQFGRIDTSMILPSSAEPGTTWIISGEAQVSSAKFAGISNKFNVIPDVPNPNDRTTYVAQEGDNLRNIAVKFNRELDALFEANPQIRVTGQLSAGDNITIPAQETSGAAIQINPICGSAETNLRVIGSRFPPLTTVTLSMGPYLVAYEPVGQTTTSPNRTFQTQLTIPVTAQNGENWVVIGNTSDFSQVQSTSNIFIVTPPPDPKEPSLYIVKPGDTLNQIAAQYQRTVAAILSVNPQINNPNQLEIDEKIIIPGQIETILISPVSGPVQTSIEAAGLGFPPFSSVTLGLMREGNLYSIEGAIATDVNGFFTTEYLIPTTAQPGEVWNTVAIRSGSSGSEIIARSNDFTVTNVQPPLKPSLTIWPLDGPPHTEISVVGSNYPALSELRYSFGREGEIPFVTSTVWSEINGTFAVDIMIPASAEPGVDWLVTAESVENQTVIATSPPFTVTSP
ncbi:MAG: LysM peptidoglycan-binding domain-containing protein [Anaerolineales bacterium]|jgi:LysM repeat protein